jgi:ABC-type nickel/cobalt efflux system permease component RcnA
MSKKKDWNQDKEIALIEQGFSHLKEMSKQNKETHEKQHQELKALIAQHREDLKSLTESVDLNTRWRYILIGAFVLIDILLLPIALYVLKRMIDRIV